jgi:tetratricopeptide (TPR) repeat protein
LFKQFLHAAMRTGKKVLLIVDEAQQLNADLLAILQGLIKLEENGVRLLRLFLVGHNDFNTMLFQPENNTFRQQISASFILSPLTRAETEEYMQYRLRLVNGAGNIFSPEAIEEIHAFANGLPRLINLICDLALLSGSAEAAGTISKKIVTNCIKNLLPPNEGAQRPHPLAAQPAGKSGPPADEAKPPRRRRLKPRYGIIVVLMLAAVFVGDLLLDKLRVTDNEVAPDKPPIAVEEPTKKTPGVQDRLQPLLTEIQDTKKEQDITKEPANEPETIDKPLIPAEELMTANSTLENDGKIPGLVKEIPTGKPVSPRHVTNLSPIQQTLSEILASKIQKKQEVPASPPESPREAAAAVDMGILSTKEVTISGNLRVEPSTRSTVITVVPQGEIVYELREKNGWLFIRLKDGRLGWMHQSVFIPRQVETEPATAAAALDAVVEQKVSGLAKQWPENSNSREVATPKKIPVPETTVKTPEQFPAPPPAAAATSQIMTAARQKAEKQPEPAPAADLESSSPKQTLPPAQEQNAAPRAIAETKSAQTPAAPEKKETTTPGDASSNVKNTLVSTNNTEALEWVRKSYQSVSRLDYKAAIAEATKAIALDPGRPEPYINRAWAYTETGVYEKAIEDCTVALRIDPDNALAYNNKGLAYHRMGDLRLARDNYQQACDRKLQIACNNLEQVTTGLSVIPLLEKGQALLEQQKWDAARQLSSEILKLDPKNTEALLLRTAADQKEKDHKLALEWTQKSYLAVSAGRYAEAIEAATKAITLNAGLVNPYINRAWAYSETKAYDKAIIDCNTVLTMEPDNALALNNMGLAYQNMGDSVKAREYYIKACEQKLAVACDNLEKMIINR